MKVFASRALRLGWFPVLLLLAGCASQQEGERCDSRNGQLDCESGLQCTPINPQGGLPYSLCCPISGTITVAACNQTTPVSDAGASTDTNTRTDANDGSTADSPAPGNEAGLDSVTQDRTTVDAREEATIDVRADRPNTDVTPDGGGDDAIDTGANDVSVDPGSSDVSVDVSSDPSDDASTETGADSILTDVPQPDVILDVLTADSAG